MDINKLKEELQNIKENVIVTDTNEGFPITITIGEYSFIIDENGNIEALGLKPTVDLSSIKITLKEGEEIPTDGVDEGTELKITFIANIKDGAIINVTPGNIQNGQIIYTTTGTEKEVTFKIIGKVGNDIYETSYTVSLKEYYKKIEFEVEDIKKMPNTFYGAEVTGYICPSDGVSKWRIYYADSSNIYLIADDYIDYTKAPVGQNGSEITKGGNNYRVSFSNVYKDYEGSEWILGNHTDSDGKVIENSLAKKWLNKYFNYTPDDGKTYPNKTSTKINIRAIAYLMDTTKWSAMYKGENAEYAIGAPPFEMCYESYKQTHPTSSGNYDVLERGYKINSISLAWDCNEIYIKQYSLKGNGIWLASPASSNDESLVFTNNSGMIGSYDYNYGDPGLRPIVCLKSDVKLKKKSEGVYEIQKNS